MRSKVGCWARLPAEVWGLGMSSQKHYGTQACGHSQQLFTYGTGWMETNNFFRQPSGSSLQSWRDLDDDEKKKRGEQGLKHFSWRASFPGSWHKAVFWSPVASPFRTCLPNVLQARGPILGATMLGTPHWFPILCKTVSKHLAWHLNPLWSSFSLTSYFLPHLVFLNIVFGCRESKILLIVRYMLISEMLKYEKVDTLESTKHDILQWNGTACTLPRAMLFQALCFFSF